MDFCPSDSVDKLDMGRMIGHSVAPNIRHGAKRHNTDHKRFMGRTNDRVLLRKGAFIFRDRSFMGQSNAFFTLRTFLINGIFERVLSGKYHRS
tara:strand:+ start:1737 stop:2015 length:279 start_codon:yes stop_codon:yes gene_type:complete